MSKAIHIHPHDHKNSWDWKVILRFLDNLKIEKPTSVLELAGGMGNIAYHYAVKGASASVYEINFSYLEHATKRHPSISGLIYDINKRLPLANDSVDLVCCVGILHYGYIKNVAAVLEEARRVSKKYILIDLFSATCWYRPIEKLLHPYSNPRRFFKKETGVLFAGLNLKVIDSISTRSLPIINKLYPFSGKTVLFLLEKYD